MTWFNTRGKHTNTLCHLAVQGMGGGGIINLASIILSDLVSLAERGVYQAYLVLTYAIASAIGPAIVSLFAVSRILPDYNVHRVAHLPKERHGVGFSVGHTKSEHLVLEADIDILDINLPLCAICFALVLFFLKVRTPPGSVKDKLSKIDWL